MSAAQSATLAAMTHNNEKQPIYMTSGEPIPPERFEAMKANVSIISDHPATALALASVITAVSGPQFQLLQMLSPASAARQLAKALDTVMSVGSTLGYMAAREDIDIERYLADMEASLRATNPAAAASYDAFMSAESPHDDADTAQDVPPAPPVFNALLGRMISPDLMRRAQAARDAARKVSGDN